MTIFDEVSYTPRTDEVSKPWGNYRNGGFVDANFARSLERELGDHQKAINALQVYVERITKTNITIERELSAAKDELDTLCARNAQLGKALEKITDSTDARWDEYSSTIAKEALTTVK